MELKEFVAETLIAIHDGIANAITKLSEAGGRGTIVPCWIDDEEGWKANVEKVEFDIAVTTSDKTGGTIKGGGKIYLVANIGGEAAKSHEKSFANKVKFSIPMVFPATARYAKAPKVK